MLTGVTLPHDILAATAALSADNSESLVLDASRDQSYQGTIDADGGRLAAGRRVHATGHGGGGSGGSRGPHAGSYLTLNDLSNAAAVRLSRLSQQAEEMTELNKAILLSLESNQPRLHDDPLDSDQLVTASATGPGNTILSSSASSTVAVATAAAGAPAEESVDLLMAMGFAREDCVKALRRCRNDLDRAADMLLLSS